MNSGECRDLYLSKMQKIHRHEPIPKQVTIPSEVQNILEEMKHIYEPETTMKKYQMSFP